MKVALVHDYIKEYGGAERVLEALHKIYPKAPIYTSVYIPNSLGPHKERFKQWDIRTSWLQFLPFKGRLISPLRIVAPWVFSRFDLSDYDLVIVSATGAYSPNTIKTKVETNGKSEGTVHVSYTHTPPRYLYGLATARDWKKNKLVSFFSHIVFHFLRIVDHDSSKRVDFFIANSRETAKRIEKHYRRRAIVVNPPVQLLKGATNKQTPVNRDYYVAGGRLAKAKHPELAVKAANKLGVNLKVFGKSFAGYGKELRKLAGPTVEILGEVDEDQKWELLKNAKAYLSPSDHEDFGILNVEAQSAGTPVIAHASGGVEETIVDKKTGVLFEKLTAESLVKAIKSFEKLNLKPVDCRNQAKKFNEDKFRSKIEKFVESKVKQ